MKSKTETFETLKREPSAPPPANPITEAILEFNLISILSLSPLDPAVLNQNFQLEPQNLSLPAGQMAVFHCAAPRGVPMPRIYWKKDDQIVRAGFGRVQQLTNGSLIVNGVRKIDEGRFVCIAENMLGIRESSFATLTVYGKCLVSELSFKLTSGSPFPLPPHRPQ